jgi:putative ABC transport system substrate-binding protein
MAALSLALIATMPSGFGQVSTRMTRIGVLTLSIAPESRTFEAFRQGLRDLGYTEGGNVAIVFRYAQGQPDALPAMARDLANSKVDIIVTESVQAAREARRATEVIPIVTAVHGDPVGAGLAKSLTRPEGNVTGLSLLAPELSGKRLQLLKEMSPKASKVGALWNPGNPAAAHYLAETRSAARSLGIELVAVEARNPAELGSAFSSLAASRPNAFVSLPDGMLLANRQHIIDFVARAGIPAIYPDAEFATAGGLMAYGPSLAANFRQAATYVDKILKGAKPGELPIEQPTRFELAINLRTAESIKIAIPASLVQRADHLIK